MKYNNYVALIQSNNRVKYVTKVNHETKTAHWKDGEAALKMTKTAAEDLVFGLTCNGFQAVIIRTPDFMEPCNPEKEGVDND